MTVRSAGALAPAFLLALAGGCAARAGSQAAPPADPFVHAFRVLRPSVVLFTMKIPSDDPKARGTLDDAYGSGVIVASDERGSTVLTVQHVIDGARELRVTLDDRRSVAAHVIASDAQRDLALVAIDVPHRAVAILGKSAGVEPGTQVGVAGYPIPDAFAGEHLHVKTSVYAGRVSSVRDDSLELDLPVIPGESGGPVFEAATGTVLALAESRFDDERAIGFGIPIDVAKRFLRRHVIAYRASDRAAEIR